MLCLVIVAASGCGSPSANEGGNAGGGSRTIIGTVTDASGSTCEGSAPVETTISFVPADPLLSVRSQVSRLGPCEGSFEVEVTRDAEYAVCIDRVTSDPEAADVVARGTCGGTIPMSALADGRLDITLGDGVEYS
jgi:hypothetical protein